MHDNIKNGREIGKEKLMCEGCAFMGGWREEFIVFGGGLGYWGSILNFSEVWCRFKLSMQKSKKYSKKLQNF